MAFLFGGLPLSQSGSSTYSRLYVDEVAGSDTNSGLEQATAFATLTAAAAVASSRTAIYAASGTYRNPGFGQGGGGNNAAMALQDVNHILLANLPGHYPRIEFDGSSGISARNVSQFEIRGFEVAGPSEGQASRLGQAPRHSSARGIDISGSERLIIHNNVIHGTPGSAIQVAGSDYCTIENNVIFNSTWWPSSTESAIVLAESRCDERFGKGRFRRCQGLRWRRGVSGCLGLR